MSVRSCSEGKTYVVFRQNVKILLMSEVTKKSWRMDAGRGTFSDLFHQKTASSKGPSAHYLYSKVWILGHITFFCLLCRFSVQCAEANYTKFSISVLNEIHCPFSQWYHTSSKIAVHAAGGISSCLEPLPVPNPIMLTIRVVYTRHGSYQVGEQVTSSASWRGAAWPWI